MECKKCGAENTDAANFCFNCASPLKYENNQKKRNKKKGTKLFVIIVIALITIIVIRLCNNKSKSGKNEISYNYSEDNIPKFIDGTFSNKKINSSKDVLEALESVKEEMKFNDISKELKLYSTEKSENITYYKYEQVYKEIPVYKQNIIISVDKNKKITGLSGYYIPNINVDVNPKKSKAEIEKTIKANLDDNPVIISNDLYIWASSKTQDLIYVAEGYSDTKIVELIIDANSGEILSETSVLDSVKSTSYTGLGMDNKTYIIDLKEDTPILDDKTKYYRFNDSKRKISIIDFRNQGSISSLPFSFLPSVPIIIKTEDGKLETKNEEEEKFIQSAITTMANFEKIYDYYKNVLGRDSYDNKGSDITVYLGVKQKMFSNEDLNNAFWSFLTKKIYIGDQDGKSLSASLDVLAHEFTHGVIDSTANFTRTIKKGDENKAFETGALSEAYGDIMGNLIEKENWAFAENNGTYRDLVNPNLRKDPEKKDGLYYFPDGYLKNGKTLEQLLKEKSEKNNIIFETVKDFDNGAVHNNATVIGHAAYLMHRDNVFGSDEEMAKVWYNSLFLLSSYANFEDCALAVIKSAKNQGFSDATIYKITKIFQDANVLKEVNYKLSGTVRSGKNKVKNAEIEIYSYKDNNLITTVTTTSNGEYTIELPLGMYNIKVKKNLYKEYNTTSTINGDTKLDIHLAKKEKKKENKFKEKGKGLTKVCESNDCINLTFCVLQSDENGNLTENSETYVIKKGSKINAELLVNTINNALKKDLLSTDGKSYHISIGKIDVEFAWYYKDTDTLFNWNEPINEDTAIETKYMNGAIDNESLIKIDEWLRKANLK